MKASSMARRYGGRAARGTMPRQHAAATEVNPGFVSRLENGRRQVSARACTAACRDVRDGRHASLSAAIAPSLLGRLGSLFQPGPAFLWRRAVLRPRFGWGRLLTLHLVQHELVHDVPGLSEEIGSLRIRDWRLVGTVPRGCPVSHIVCEDLEGIDVLPTDGVRLPEEVPRGAPVGYWALPRCATRAKRLYGPIAEEACLFRVLRCFPQIRKGDPEVVAHTLDREEPDYVARLDSRHPRRLGPQQKSLG